jgi:beta-carotene 15,15'-dioxygenase
MDILKSWAYTISATPTLVSIAAGCLLLIWQLFVGELPPPLQMAFFAVFILFTGIPHGAIDHLVEKETAERQQKSFNLLGFLSKYLLTMGIYAGAWFVLPSLSLLFFLLISAWHFGETDIENAPPTALWNAARFSFGCFILSWILLFHAVEVTPILERISQNNDAVQAVWLLCVGFKEVILIAFAVATGMFSYFANKKNTLNFDKMRLIRLASIVLLTYFLPLLPAFGLYFGGWHALCSFDNIHHYLLSRNTKTSEASILKTWSKTLGFTLLAMSFLAFATWFWLRFYHTWDALPLLFIFLSLITLPHLNVMHRMSKFSAAPF